jgi:hypothetical protein
MECRQWQLADQVWFAQVRAELLGHALPAELVFDLVESSAVSVRAQLAALRRSVRHQLRRIAGVVGR